MLVGVAARIRAGGARAGQRRARQDSRTRRRPRHCPSRPRRIPTARFAAHTAEALGDSVTQISIASADDRRLPWRSAGYHVSLIFLSLPSAELAIQRVAQRVRQGGHAVSDEVVRRRFHRGRDHFETLYKPLVNTQPRLRSRSLRFVARGYAPSRSQAPRTPVWSSTAMARSSWSPARATDRAIGRSGHVNTRSSSIGRRLAS